MHRFVVLREIFWKPLWGWIGLLWAVFKIILDSLSIFEIGISDAEEIVMNSPAAFLVIFVRDNFWFLSITIVSLAIAEGMYKKTRRFLGERINAKLSFELFPRQSDGYVSVKIHNGEYEDLLEPELSYLELSLITIEEEIPKLKELNGGDAYISWWLGATDKDVIRGEKSAAFNLAIIEDRKLYFLFDDGSKSEAQVGLYKAVLAINGRMGIENKKVKRKIKTCYLEYQIGIEEIHENDELRVYYVAYIDIREEKKAEKEIARASEKKAFSHDETLKYVRGEKNG